MITIIETKGGPDTLPETKDESSEIGGTSVDMSAKRQIEECLNNAKKIAADKANQDMTQVVEYIDMALNELNLPTDEEQEDTADVEAMRSTEKKDYLDRAND